MNVHPDTLRSPQEAYRNVRAALQEAGIEDAGLDAQLLIRHVTGGLWFSVEELSPAQAAALANLANRRAAHEPLHYLTGSCTFLEVPLAVGPGVLIPRPETEELCLYAAGLMKEVAAPKVLDLCAGSGAISLALQTLLPAADIAAIEWDEKAYSYLERNLLVYKKSHPRAPIARRADVLNAGRLFPPSYYDLIVCNPPYVTEDEYQKLAPELLYEPKQALVAEGEDPLVFYETVARDYLKSLKPGGFLVFEIGAGQATKVRKILKDNGYTKIAVTKDMAGHNRIAKGQKAEG